MWLTNILLRSPFVIASVEGLLCWWPCLLHMPSVRVECACLQPTPIAPSGLSCSWWYSHQLVRATEDKRRTARNFLRGKKGREEGGGDIVQPLLNFTAENKTFSPPVTFSMSSLSALFFSSTNFGSRMD